MLVPGPAVVYVVARSVEGGRPAGIVSVLGVELGTLVHVAFAAAGLSAILASSATAFSVVKWLGVAYLIWLGLQRLLARDENGDAPPDVRPEPLARVFGQSVVVQVLNPKVALFFLAFLPQFVDPSRGAAWTQVVVLGGTAGDWLKRNNASARFRHAQRYVSGGIYLALGAVAAATGSGKD